MGDFTSHPASVHKQRSSASTPLSVHALTPLVGLHASTPLSLRMRPGALEKDVYIFLTSKRQLLQRGKPPRTVRRHLL
jgi:hypothetical protein